MFFVLAACARGPYCEFADDAHVALALTYDAGKSLIVAVSENRERVLFEGKGIYNIQWAEIGGVLYIIADRSIYRGTLCDMRKVGDIPGPNTWLFRTYLGADKALRIASIDYNETEESKRARIVGYAETGELSPERTSYEYDIGAHYGIYKVAGGEIVFDGESSEVVAMAAADGEYIPPVLWDHAGALAGDVPQDGFRASPFYMYDETCPSEFAATVRKRYKRVREPLPCLK
jgi:hypothetical protein